MAETPTICAEVQITGTALVRAQSLDAALGHALPWATKGFVLLTVEGKVFKLVGASVEFSQVEQSCTGG